MDDRLEAIESLLREEFTARDKHWHLKKEVTVAHILSTFGMVSLVLASWFSLTAAVEAVETRTSSITDGRIVAIEQKIEALNRQVNSSLGRIETKLTRLEDKFDQRYQDE